MGTATKIKHMQADRHEFLVQCLALHGAKTDWHSESDPLWFRTEEDLLAFILWFSEAS